MVPPSFNYQYSTVSPLTGDFLYLTPSFQILRKNKQTKNPNRLLLASPLQIRLKPEFSWIPKSQLLCLHGDFSGVQFSSRLPGRLHIFQREENACAGTALEPLIPEAQILQQQKETKEAVFSGSEMEEKQFWLNQHLAMKTLFVRKFPAKSAGGKNINILSHCSESS